MKTHLVYFVSFVAVSCFQLSYLSPKIVAVCPFVTDLCMQAWFIISTGPIFPGISALLWCFSNFLACAIVCARTTSDHWRSRISRDAHGQLRCSNRHDFNCFPGACAFVNQQ
ncbi:hypothetical protein EV702DRAFT_1080225 [Suillus placidus]|uniref:Uncharacterized protein n=1 Tax=Suillus placidus TaxID=48579 RepID=A0A9P7D6F4_9AGAM|nr:hypothetical protein EV702DRAFT_1080225 [Suillus placidus]